MLPFELVGVVTLGKMTYLMTVLADDDYTIAAVVCCMLFVGRQM